MTKFFSDNFIFSYQVNLTDGDNIRRVLENDKKTQTTNVFFYVNFNMICKF